VASKCSLCGRKAIYERTIEGKSFCEKCFSEQLERKVKKTIRMNNLIKRNDKIAVGLSGGKDSSTILYMLNKFFKKRPDIKIIAITIDEGIKGYRNKSVKSCEKLAKELGIEHHTVSFKETFGMTLDQIVKKKKLNACTFCGVFRRYALNIAARKFKATKVCTGHNLDDEAQALLINYLRGDMNRLSRMGPKPFVLEDDKFVPRIKPLREIPEREVAIYALVNNVGNYWGECPYVSGIRFEVRDFLNDLEINHPGTKHSFVAAFDKILPHIRESVRGVNLNYCKNCGEPTSVDICKSCELLAMLKKSY
jgi:uncharacterized protein (TIGR00269 family)